MKTRFLAIAVVVCLSPLFSPLLFGQDVKSTVTSIEKSLWEAWKTHQMRPFEQYLTADTVNVTSQGFTAGKEAVIKDMTANPCEVRNYSLSDWQFHEISSDTVMLTYKAKQDATCRGSKIPAEVLATAVYVKKNGKWMAASYQETPMMNASSMKAE